MKIIHCIAAMTVAAGLAGVAQGQAMNLLANPGAESGLTGWSDPLGHGFQVVHWGDLTYVGVIEGSHAFWAGDSGPTGPWNHELRQDVDVSGYAARIDVGEARWCLVTDIYARYFEGDLSLGQVAVEMRDAGGAVLDSWETPLVHSLGAYVGHRRTDIVPAGTRTIRFRMLAWRDGGDVTDVLFDAQSLELHFPPEVYCTAQMNSSGCLPAITFSGSPSESAPGPFLIEAQNIINNRPGLLFYGLAADALPFMGGTLCVQDTLTRTPPQDSGGSASGVDCTGSFSFDFNALIQSGSNPWLRACTLVYAQYWSRDPASPSLTNLTDAVHFTIAP